jgi:hypothetical protein
MHLSRLERIKSLQSEGRMLAEIGPMLDERPGPATCLEASAWWQYAISDEVIVWAKADLAPWKTKQVRAAIDELAKRLGKTEGST